jgi:hypothetical protein
MTREESDARPAKTGGITGLGQSVSDEEKLIQKINP